MRKHHILIVTLSLVAAACSTASSSATTSSSSTSLVITTTSTTPPTTSVMAPPPLATTIEIWVPGNLTARVREAAVAFERDTAIGVEIVAVEIDAVLDQLLADPASGPSVFIGPHAWLTTLADAGIAEPLPTRSEVVAGAVAAVTMREVVFAAPLALDTIVQFRNTDTLAVAPSTIESLAAGCFDTEPCLVLAADSVDGHYPFLTGTGGYIFGSDEFDGWNPDDVGVDSPAALAGGLILQAIVEGAGILDQGSSTAEDRFIASDAPLLWGGTGSLAALKLAGIGFVVERLPSIAESAAPAPVRVTAAWVNAFSPDKEAAATFVVDYLAAPQNADLIAVALGLAPVNVGFDADPDLLPFIESARTGDPVPTIFEVDFAWEQLAIAFEDIRDGDEATDALSDAAIAIRNAPPLEPTVEEEES